MAGKVMEAIYNQNNFVLESLGKDWFDNQQMWKVFRWSNHKVEILDEFKTNLPLSIQFSFRSFHFAQNSDYDTIAKIAKDVYMRF